MKHVWMIWYAIALHWVWGVVLLSSTAPLNITAISTIVQLGVVSSNIAGLFYLLIASIAMIGLFGPRRTSLIFLLPQTAVLWMAAYGALTAMITGTFADGVVRPVAFLVTDQAPAVLAALFHTLAVLNHHFRDEHDNPRAPR